MCLPYAWTVSEWGSNPDPDPAHQSNQNRWYSIITRQVQSITVWAWKSRKPSFTYLKSDPSHSPSLHDVWIRADFRIGGFHEQYVSSYKVSYSYLPHYLNLHINLVLTDFSQILDCIVLFLHSYHVLLPLVNVLPQERHSFRLRVEAWCKVY